MDLILTAPASRLGPVASAKNILVTKLRADEAVARDFVRHAGAAAE